MIDVVDRPGEFAPDQVMREIGGQPQIGKAVEQIERDAQIKMTIDQREAEARCFSSRCRGTRVTIGRF